jgi:hypothetical protein
LASGARCRSIRTVVPASAPGPIIPDVAVKFHATRRDFLRPTNPCGYGPGAGAEKTSENATHGAIKSRRHWDGEIYGLICKFCKSEFFENQNIFVLGRPLAAPQRCQNKNIENNPMQSKSALVCGAVPQ